MSPDIVHVGQLRITKARAEVTQNGFWPNLIHIHHPSTAHVMAVCATPKLEELDSILERLADTQGVGLNLQLISHFFFIQVIKLLVVFVVNCVWFWKNPGRAPFAVHEVGSRVHPLSNSQPPHLTGCVDRYGKRERECCN